MASCMPSVPNILECHLETHTVKLYVIHMPSDTDGKNTQRKGIYFE